MIIDELDKNDPVTSIDVFEAIANGCESIFHLGVEYKGWDQMQNLYSWLMWGYTVNWDGLDYKEYGNE